MSDHQFQEREYEGARQPPEMMTDLMDLLMGRIGAPTSGSLGYQQMQELLSSLPRLTEEDLVKLGHGGNDTTCPVCITSLSAILAEEEMAQAMESPAHALEEMGVTRLWIASRDEGKRGCGHLFCRRCISKWIGGGHDTCPSCRHALIERSPAPATLDATSAPSDSEEEAALQQLQQQMRAFRSVLEGTAAGGTDLERQIREMFSAQGMFSEPRVGVSAEQSDDRSEFSGMYS